MSSKMTPYYVSRTIISAVFGLLLFISGAAWWTALLLSSLILGLFIWAPHSGRYSVHPELGVTALRRDERTQVINDKAARNAFVVCMLALAALVIYFGSLGAASISIHIFQAILVIGALAYLVSDLWLRRSQQ